jgi:hypothetical protein
MKDDKGFEMYGVKKDLSLITHTIHNLIKVEEDPNNSSKFDFKSNLYKKKLKPLVDKIIANEEQ